MHIRLSYCNHPFVIDVLSLNPPAHIIRSLIAAFRGSPGQGAEVIYLIGIRDFCFFGGGRLSFSFSPLHGKMYNPEALAHLFLSGLGVFVFERERKLRKGVSFGVA